MFAPFCDSKTSVRINASVAFKNIDATLDGIAFEVKTDAATDSGGATGTTDSFFVRVAIIATPRSVVVVVELDPFGWRSSLPGSLFRTGHDGMLSQCKLGSVR